MYRTVYSWKEIYDDLLLTKPSLSMYRAVRVAESQPCLRNCGNMPPLIRYALLLQVSLHKTSEMVAVLQQRYILHSG